MADDLNRKGAENQVKCAGKEFKGRVKDAVGGLTGDGSEQIEGKVDQLKGKVQRKIGETQSDVDRDF
jgi:uncharacterized protein YjbJ (UPF0337 family)